MCGLCGRQNGGLLTSQEWWWNPEGMVPGMPGKPKESGPNPQSCDTLCSQSRVWDHQGCLGHFQGGQEGHIQVLGPQEGPPGVFPQFQYCGPSSGRI